MGYYTRFSLSTKENKYKVSDIIGYMKNEWCISRQRKYYPFRHDFDVWLCVDKIVDFEFEISDEAKWYDHKKEMKELSLQFPETVFCLYGEGEKSADQWYHYFKNGKTQYCPAIITFEEYDENKLT